MASNGTDSTTGAPRFPETDAPEIGTDLQIVADYAALVGTRLIGSTAEREAYQFGRLGLLWRDTSDGYTYEHDGTGWRLKWWDTGWQNITQFGGNASPGSPPPQWRLKDGFVYLQGTVNCAVDVFDGWGITTLPANIRPPVSKTFAAYGATGAGSMRLFVSSAGNVVASAPKNGTSTYLSLDNASWTI